MDPKFDLSNPQEALRAQLGLTPEEFSYLQTLWNTPRESWPQSLQDYYEEHLPESVKQSRKAQEDPNFNILSYTMAQVASRTEDEEIAHVQSIMSEMDAVFSGWIKEQRQ